MVYGNFRDNKYEGFSWVNLNGVIGFGEMKDGTWDGNFSGYFPDGEMENRTYTNG